MTPGVAIVYLIYKGVRQQRSSTANEVWLDGKILSGSIFLCWFAYLFFKDTAEYLYFPFTISAFLWLHRLWTVCVKLEENVFNEVKRVFFFSFVVCELLQRTQSLQLNMFFVSEPWVTSMRVLKSCSSTNPVSSKSQQRHHSPRL